MLFLSTSRVPTVFLHGWSQEREGTYQAEGITRIRVLVLDRNLRTVSLCKIAHSNHQRAPFLLRRPTGGFGASRKGNSRAALRRIAWPYQRPLRIPSVQLTPLPRLVPSECVLGGGDKSFLLDCFSPFSTQHPASNRDPSSQLTCPTPLPSQKPSQTLSQKPTST